MLLIFYLFFVEFAASILGYINGCSISTVIVMDTITLLSLVLLSIIMFSNYSQEDKKNKHYWLLP